MKIKKKKIRIEAKGKIGNQKVSFQKKTKCYIITTQSQSLFSCLLQLQKLETAKPLSSLLFLCVNCDQRKRKCWLFLTNLWPRVLRLFRVLNRDRSRLWKMGFWPTTLALSTLAQSLSTSPLRASLPTRSKIRTHSYPGILQSHFFYAPRNWKYGVSILCFFLVLWFLGCSDLGDSWVCLVFGEKW